MTCTCRANNCDEYHAVCVCGCTLGRALCRNADEFIRGLVEFRRSEAQAKDAVSAGNRQDASPGADEKKGEGIISPTARSAYYDWKRCFPF